MNVEALWVMKFVDPRGPVTAANVAGGVVVLETGRLFGGDSGAYYVGNYTVKDGVLRFRAHVRFHDRDVEPILPGLRDYVLLGEGHSDDGMKSIHFRGSVEGQPSVGLVGRLDRVAELP